MKILHITNTLEEGGLETFLYELLPLLKNNNIDVELLVLDKNKVKLKPIFEEKGIKIHTGKFNCIYNPLNIFIIRKYLKKYDIIHIHLFPTQYFAAIAKLLIFKVPIMITTEHSSYNRRRSKYWLRLIETFIYKQYRYITTVSFEAKNCLDKWAKTSNKTYAIYNGINLNQYHNASPHPRQNLGFTNDDKLILMVARFFSQKDHLTPIKALSLTPFNTHLLYVGSGDTVDFYKEKAKEYGVADRIHFLGRRSDIPELAKMCNIGLLASNYEGFGLSTLEIMAAGKPVIVSDIDGIRELVKGYGLLFKNYDINDLAEKITSLNDPIYYESIRIQCLKRSKDFDISKTVQQYIKLYTTSYNE
ncbi:glycosyltransferase [uncultured Parabacteroides sp.]|jgi:glycosyltransferase involved in cell wall biosynthesis|uniref:glycosyltransferase n=1 Tax=uncultured Parabacteroides sp. TaxID=512312 RepID=UPI0025D5600B|nr:glycosyltransferase [uncultured Parabacteroides sp.]